MDRQPRPRDAEDYPPQVSSCPADVEEMTAVSRRGITCVALMSALAGCSNARDITSAAASLHKEHVASARYAEQLTQIHLPSSYELVSREQGGTYVAAGNGPYASAAYRTRQGLNAVIIEVQQAMEQAGYTVQRATPDEHGVVRLEGKAPARDLEARIGAGTVYDMPFGSVAAVPGTTGVLLVVEDQGRSRQ